MLCLLGERFELCAHVRGRELEKLRGRFDARELTSKVEGCVHILLGHLKKMEIKMRGTLRGGGVGALHDLRGFLGGGLGFSVCVLDALSTLLDNSRATFSVMVLDLLKADVAVPQGVSIMPLLQANRSVPTVFAQGQRPTGRVLVFSPERPSPPAAHPSPV